MTLRYVYGIAPSEAAVAIDTARLEGIDGASVHALVDGPFAAATSDLDAGEYGSERLNERVRDMDWLTPRAEAHQRVNERVLDVAGAVIPLAFGVLYLNETGVRAMLREDAAARRSRLAALAGRAEWIVTISREVAAVPSGDDELRRLDSEIASSAPGRAFLLERRRTSVASAATARADADVTDRALERLQRVAERTYREPVVKGADVVVLRVSLLARRDDAARVDRAVSELEAEIDPRGYRVRATGPWPAYRFGSLP